MEEVNKVIDINGNDILSSFSGRDLCSLFDSIIFSNLELRKSLGINPDITFGLEIESEYAKIDRIVSEITNGPKWDIKADASLENGIEINSPILTDNIITWNELKSICSILDKYSKIGVNAASHVHIGTQILGIDPINFINFLKLWSVYEDIILRFTNGEYLTERKRIKKYADNVSNDFDLKYKGLLKMKNISKEELLSFISDTSRYKAVNFARFYPTEKQEANNTIEFRSPNGTLNPIVWQNNVNTFVKMIEYCKNSSYDNDTIDRRYKTDYEKAFNSSNVLNIEKALEFCDLIFNNNLDKIYFLKQYLKSLEESKKHNYKKLKIF